MVAGPGVRSSVGLLVDGSFFISLVAKYISTSLLGFLSNGYSVHSCNFDMSMGKGKLRVFLLYDVDTDQVSELIPGKEELNIVRLYAHRGDAVTVYVSGGNPILFELEKNLYPTGMAIGWRWPLLWSLPDICFSLFLPLTCLP